MVKSNFVIIGTGWRAQYYVRIAKALPEIFNLQAVYSRTQEKAEEFSREHKIHGTNSLEEIINLKPDFVVIAVKKDEGLKTARQWLEYGFTVLMETPAALTKEALDEVKEIQKTGKKLVVAEQYIFYPEYSAVLKLLSTGLIGEVNYISISSAHEYHGASLMRHFLEVEDLPEKVMVKTFSYPTTETLTRYESFTDGRIKNKNRTVGLFEFMANKAAVYDFDSEQYRSPIRKNQLKIQGVRGEIHDRKVYYLDSQNRPVESEIKIESRTIETENSNPNLHYVKEITEISFEGKVLYTPPFGCCGLAEDETAIAVLMESTGRYAKGLVKEPLYPLKKAVLDAEMMFMMQEKD